jgi:hypothetical protein
VKTCFFLIAVSLYTSAKSQQHFLRPERFYYSVRDLAKVRIITGDSLSDEEPAAWILRPGSEHLEEMKKEIKDETITLPLSETGTYILSVQGYSSKLGHKDGKVLHFDKALLQVGHDFSESATHYCGFSLEIVPEENPSVSPENIRHASLPRVRFRVYRYHQPAALLPVFYRYTLPDGTEKTERLESDKRGWLQVTRYPGAGLLFTFIPASGSSPALSASLSFEFSQFFNEKPPTQ